MLNFRSYEYRIGIPDHNDQVCTHGLLSNWILPIGSYPKNAIQGSLKCCLCFKVIYTSISLKFSTFFLPFSGLFFCWPLRPVPGLIAKHELIIGLKWAFAFKSPILRSGGAILAFQSVRPRCPRSRKGSNWIWIARDLCATLNRVPQNR